VENNSEFTFFIALSKYGSLSGTARELNLTPSAVTKRLSSLEARLGVRLINRTTRKLSLTNEGELYLKSAKEISAKIYELEAALSMRKDSPSGLLKVNAPLGFGRNYISPIISEFISQYPDVQVELMLTDRPMSLPDESVDVCIQFGKIPDSRLIARKIAKNRRLLCASPKYLQQHGRPSKPSELLNHNCIIIKQNQQVAASWRFEDELGYEEVIKTKGNLLTNDGEIALRWAIEGHGIVMRAEWDIAKYIRSEKLEVILNDYTTPEADIYAVYMERLNLSAKVTTFLDYLTESFLNNKNDSSIW
jgi:LysR family transcriptional regulator, transcriptional activator for dmlA